MTKELYLGIRSQLNFSYRLSSLTSHYFIDGILVFLILFLAQQTIGIAFLAAIPIATLMIRNVSLMHEAVHGIAHPNSNINYFIGLLAGTTCLLPFYLWKKIHMEHHFWAGNFNKDPSLEIIKRYPRSSDLIKFLLNFSWKTRIPLTALLQYIVFWGHSFLGLLKNYKKGLLWVNMTMPVAIWTVIIWHASGPHLAILATGIIVYLLFFEVINFPHHVGLYLEDNESSRLLPWQQYEVTRTSRYPQWIEKLAVLNFNYHAEHHVFPDLPWHQLPKAHQLIQHSKIQSATTVVGGDWLRNKRKLPFVNFLRPDMAIFSKSKDQNENVA